jgi:hypothetical protein
MAGENALSRLDDQAYEQILNTTCCTGIELDELDEEGQTHKVRNECLLKWAWGSKVGVGI